ncbi:MAG TPA: ABC transporter substrate-binding protein [Candidatus Acidoferrum sp.]|nr:ABC transporter substrate-binding protein [Candidatus Acidoferrum sp.]
MTPIKIALLRGICQTPAYAACEQGFFKAEGLDVEVEIAATAWLIPHKLTTGECQFTVMPWTRVAVAAGHPFVLLAGSGYEEAAMVMRMGITEALVRRVAIPLRGGIKDLTAMGLIRSLGWRDVEILRQPSGDGAIIAFFGQGVDAASMVEPYATMMEHLGAGRVIRRTGDLWKGAPGCSLTTTVSYKQREPEVVAGVVRAFARGATFVRRHPDEAAQMAARYIGINPRFIRAALDKNQPNLDALRNTAAMDQILKLMADLGYVRGPSSGFADLSFLDAVQAQLAGAAPRAARGSPRRAVARA